MRVVTIKVGITRSFVCSLTVTPATSCKANVVRGYKAVLKAQTSLRYVLALG